jgi:uncharacterized protein (DUF58 family)
VKAAVFPLVPRRRVVGLAFGALQGVRRGSGSDVAGTRPYVRGDDVDAIHWGATARLSSARDSTEFVVRMFHRDEAPVAVVVRDRSPSMRLFPPGLPWLAKPAAADAAARLIARSVAQERGLVGYLDGDRWEPPHRPRGANVTTPPGSGDVRSALETLALHARGLGNGTFVFVLSDFLEPPPGAAWAEALERRWDPVPVVIQDPVWEQSFPAVAGVGLPVARADGRITVARLTRAEADARRREHEARRERLLATFAAHGIRPVLVTSAAEEEVLAAFFAWAEERRFLRERGR